MSLPWFSHHFSSLPWFSHHFSIVITPKPAIFAGETAVVLLTTKRFRRFRPRSPPGSECQPRAKPSPAEPPGGGVPAISFWMFRLYVLYIIIIYINTYICIYIYVQCIWCVKLMLYVKYQQVYMLFLFWLLVSFYLGKYLFLYQYMPLLFIVCILWSYGHRRIVPCIIIIEV